MKTTTKPVQANTLYLIQCKIIFWRRVRTLEGGQLSYHLVSLSFPKKHAGSQTL